jgi:putative membrane protein
VVSLDLAGVSPDLPAARPHPEAHFLRFSPTFARPRRRAARRIGGTQLARRGHSSKDPRMAQRQHKHAFFGGAAALGFSLCALAAGTDAAFVKEAIQDNLAEVQVGQLAAQRTQSDAVRMFGEALRRDHADALQRTRKIAEAMKVDAPTQPSADARRKYAALTRLSGRDFDAAFVRQMVRDHEAAIARYRAHTHSEDDEVASYIADSLPKLQDHLTMAHALQDRVNADSSSPH